MVPATPGSAAPTPPAKPAGRAPAAKAPAPEKKPTGWAETRSAPPQAAPKAPGAAAAGADDPMERTVSSHGDVTDELAATLKELDAPRAPRKLRRKENPPLWFLHALKDSFRHSGRTIHLIRAAWQHWRKTASFLVFAAFVLVYALLAVMRKPSETVLEQSRHVADMAFLQDFLKSYVGAGGTVSTEKPHGGAELYPRGIVLQGEVLDAFRRAPVGTTLVVRPSEVEGNPLASFYGFPPVYVGGSYFHLDRKFNLSLYRFTFLLRKDTEQTGVILVANWR